jgi:P pilus assembly chaperone PapD
MNIFRSCHPLQDLNARQMAARLVCWAALASVSVAVQAAPFEVAVSPSRTELVGKAGQRVGQSIQIYNVGGQVTALSFRTMDWTLSDKGELKFHDDLLPGSCRPWVTLERRTRQVAARANVPFRFQIDVPADAPRGECRFMIAIEGIEPAQQATINSGGASLSLPVSGRIAVTVYLAVGGAKPQLELLRIGSDSVRAQRQPVVTVRNNGDAHGRLDGALDSTDSNGQRLELVPDGAPILPGQTRVLTLSPKAPASGAVPTLKYPLNLQGSLDWDDGAFKVQATLP